MREPVTTTSVMGDEESVRSVAGAGCACALAVFVTQPVASVLADRIAMRTASRRIRLSAVVMSQLLPKFFVMMLSPRATAKHPSARSLGEGVHSSLSFAVQRVCFEAKRSCYATNKAA